MCKSAKDFGKLLICQVIRTDMEEQEKVQLGSLSGFGRSFVPNKILITGFITKTRTFTSTKTDTDLKS